MQASRGHGLPIYAQAFLVGCMSVPAILDLGDLLGLELGHFPSIVAALTSAICGTILAIDWFLKGKGVLASLLIVMAAFCWLWGTYLLFF